MRKQLVEIIASKLIELEKLAGIRGEGENAIVDSGIALMTAALEKNSEQGVAIPAAISN